MQYYAIRVVNLALAVLWSFGLVSVLIRTMMLDDYALTAIVTGIGSYLLTIDVGFSSIVYARIRKEFLGSSGTPDYSIAWRMLRFYAAIALLANFVFATVLFSFELGSDGVRLGLVIHFAALSCALPWTIVRVAAAATERYMIFESTEAVRRLISLVLVFLILAGMSFTEFALLSLLTWGGTFAFALYLVPLWQAPEKPPLRVQIRLLMADVGQAWSAGTFSLLDAMVYNFPYFFVPAVFYLPSASVAFDTFFKVLRFGASAYLASTEAMLPAQTRALQHGDKRGLIRHTGMGMALGMLPMVAGVLTVTLFGDIAFRLLLKDAGMIPESVRICMAVTLVMMLVQTASGNLLINTGQAKALARIARGIASSMAVWCLVIVETGWNFQVFLVGWTCVYLVGAIAYGCLVISKISQISLKASSRGFW